MARYDRNGLERATDGLYTHRTKHGRGYELKNARQVALKELGFGGIVMNLMKTKRKKQVLYAVVELNKKNLPATSESISRYIQSHYDEHYNHNPLRMRNYLYNEKWSLKELNLIKKSGFTKKHGQLFVPTSLGKKVYKELKEDDVSNETINELAWKAETRHDSKVYGDAYDDEDLHW
jgi:hypothetical protein